MRSFEESPHDVIRLNFCPTCGRDDRWGRLKARHFWGGSICPGELVELTYAIVDGPRELEQWRAEMHADLDALGDLPRGV